MNNNFEALVRRIAAASAASDLLQPPISAAELAEAERNLGFRLHPLLAALIGKWGTVASAPQTLCFRSAAARMRTGNVGRTGIPGQDSAGRGGHMVVMA
ncbi:hypothetical protein [Streptomyces sp. NPDC015680]|uniref:hypothetical protein n=1 Tax=unclassified Streptomyces TaxID=2593676 RepID=UPI0036FAEAF1